MAPSALFDLAGIDLDLPLRDAAHIESLNPHRGAMRMLDAIVHEDFEEMRFAAYHDAREDAFWVPGHIPGRPILPGVLMVEAAAQLASYATLSHMRRVEFLGFAKIDQARFRAQVVPGQRLHLLLRLTEIRARRTVAEAQGWVDGTLAFECGITGMPM